MKPIYIYPSLASVYAKLSTLIGKNEGQGASIVGIRDASSKYNGETVEAALLEIADGTTLDTRYSKRQKKVRIVTDSDTIAITDDLVVCNKTTEMTINLPIATGSGRYYIIKNINTGIVTIDGNSSETIDGELTYELHGMESITIIDYTSGKWVVI